MQSLFMDIVRGKGSDFLFRFYEDHGLIYGRIPSVDPRDGEGICLARVMLYFVECLANPSQ
jgi:hypothetical protein